MKKLLTFLFVLISLASYSQTGTWTPIYGNQRINKGLGIPVKDTFNIRTEDSAQAVIRPQDGYMWYVYKGNWLKAFAVDTTSLSNRINLKLNISDTAAILSNYPTGLGTQYRIPVYNSSKTLIDGDIVDSLGILRIGNITGGATSKFNVQGSLKGGAYYYIPVGVLESPPIGVVTYSSSDNILNIGGVSKHASIYLDSIYIGSGKDTSATNLFIGRGAGINNSFLYGTAGFGNAGFGDSVFYQNTTGWQNTFVGGRSGVNNTTGNNNSAVGGQSLYYNTTGGRNDGFGHATLYHNTAGSYNWAGAFHALTMNQSGSYNVATGANSLYANLDSFNTAYGYQSLFSQTNAKYNTGIGYQAMVNLSTGYPNSSVGANSLIGLTTGNNNTGIGTNVSATLTTGSKNTLVGDSTGQGITTGSSNTIIGRAWGIGNISNNVIISDGDNNIRAQHDGTKWNIPSYLNVQSNGSTFGNSSASAHPITINTNVSEQSMKIIGKSDNSYVQFFKSDGTTYQGYLSAQGNNMILGTSSGDVITITGSNTNLSGSITATSLIGGKMKGNSSTPSISAGAGAGTSPTVSIMGTDMAGEITVTTGTGPASASVLCTVTFSSAYSSAPYVVFSPSNQITAQTSGNQGVYVNSGTGSFTLNTNTTVLTGATTYKFMYHVIQ